MNKRNLAYFLAGTAVGFLIARLLEEYFWKKEGNSGLLRGCAHYLRAYHGEKPEKALDQAIAIH